MKIVFDNASSKLELVSGQRVLRITDRGDGMPVLVIEDDNGTALDYPLSESEATQLLGFLKGC